MLSSDAQHSTELTSRRYTNDTAQQTETNLDIKVAAETSDPPAFQHCSNARFSPGLIFILVAGLTVVAATDTDKTSTDKKAAQKQAPGKKLTGEEAEFERRMNSIAKSVEKEDRPDKPEFKDRPGSNGAITFDDLKFEMKKSERFKRAMLTDSVNSMVGERLKLKGYIHPNSKKRGMKKFIFVRDDKECCFGPTAALYDCVLVTMADGEVGKYTLRPVTVEGEFFLKEFNGPDGRVWAIYRMKNGVIK